MNISELREKHRLKLGAKRQRYGLNREGCRGPDDGDLGGGKIYFKCKKTDFLTSTNVDILRNIELNSIHVL
jgi:hypothetical protein